MPQRALLRCCHRPESNRLGAAPTGWTKTRRGFHPASTRDDFPLGASTDSRLTSLGRGSRYLRCAPLRHVARPVRCAETNSPPFPRVAAPRHRRDPPRTEPAATPGRCRPGRRRVSLRRRRSIVQRRFLLQHSLRGWLAGRIEDSDRATANFEALGIPSTSSGAFPDGGTRDDPRAGTVRRPRFDQHGSLARAYRLHDDRSIPLCQHI